MSYDQRCFDLADIFLAEEPLLNGRQNELAQHVQDAVESWIEYERGVASGEIVPLDLMPTEQRALASSHNSPGYERPLRDVEREESEEERGAQMAEHDWDGLG